MAAHTKQSVDLSLDELREYIRSVRWQTSKDGSHSYTLTKWKPELAAMFFAFVWFIRKHGYIEVSPTSATMLTTTATGRWARRCMRRY